MLETLFLNRNGHEPAHKLKICLVHTSQSKVCSRSTGMYFLQTLKLLVEVCDDLLADIFPGKKTVSVQSKCV